MVVGSRLMVCVFGVCWMLVVGCPLLVGFVGDLLLVVCCLVFDACRLFADDCRLVVVRWALFVV